MSALRILGRLNKIPRSHDLNIPKIFLFILNYIILKAHSSSASHGQLACHLEKGSLLEGKLPTWLNENNLTLTADICSHISAKWKAEFQLKWLLHFSWDDTLYHNFVQGIKVPQIKSFLSLELPFLDSDCLKFLHQTPAWMMGVYWPSKSHSKPLPLNCASCLASHPSWSHCSIAAQLLLHGRECFL